MHAVFGEGVFLMRTRIIAALIFSILILIPTNLAQAQDPPTNVAPIVDPAVPAEFALGSCLSVDQLDCVESVQVKSSSGEFANVTSDVDQLWSSNVDSHGNLRYISVKEWILPTPDGSKTYFTSDVRLNTPAFKYNSEGKTAALMIVNVGRLPVGYQAKVSVRTSWLRPQNIQLLANSANFSQSSIPGGTLMTFSGSHAKISFYNNNQNTKGPIDWSQKADGDEMKIAFKVHHLGSSDQTSWFNTRCSHEGYTVQAFNAESAGTPRWDTESKSLVFNIWAPHLDGSGNRKSGFYRLWIPEAFAMCEWPENNLVAASELVANVFNEDGSVQEADISVAKANGMIFLDAREFHYSIPRIQISAAGSTVKPAKITPNDKASASPSPKVGKTTKPPVVAKEVVVAQERVETGGVAVLIALGVAAVTGVGLGLLAYIRTKQGKRLFQGLNKQKITKDSKTRKTKART